jgi:hypothetical protein
MSNQNQPKNKLKTGALLALTGGAVILLTLFATGSLSNIQLDAQAGHTYLVPSHGAPVQVRFLEHAGTLAEAELACEGSVVVAPNYDLFALANATVRGVHTSNGGTWEISPGPDGVYTIPAEGALVHADAGLYVDFVGPADHRLVGGVSLSGHPSPELALAAPRELVVAPRHGAAPAVAALNENYEYQPLTAGIPAVGDGIQLRLSYESLNLSAQGLIIPVANSCLAYWGDDTLHLVLRNFTATAPGDAAPRASLAAPYPDSLPLYQVGTTVVVSIGRLEVPTAEIFIPGAFIGGAEPGVEVADLPLPAVVTGAPGPHHWVVL